MWRKYINSASPDYDEICVFFPSVRWLQRILNVCQADAKSHGIIFNWNKTVCMTFKVKSAKSTVTPLLTLGGQNVNLSTNTYIWGCIGYWALRFTFRDNCGINIVQQTSCEPLIPDVQMQLKMYIFVPVVPPCMHHSYGVIISGRHACSVCVWSIILDAELYTTCPGERMLVAIRFNATFLPLRPCYKKYVPVSQKM